MNQRKPLKIALIGTSFMGKAHSNAWRNVNTTFNTIPITQQVIVGRNIDTTKEAAHKYLWKEHSTNWEATIARKDIDIIDICTPSHLHEPMILAALKHKKHVLVEKPLGNNSIETQKIEEESIKAQKNNIHTMIGFNYRTIPALKFAKKLIQENKLGKITHLKISYLQDWLHDPNTPISWRLQKKFAGSGSLSDLGSHAIDQIFYLTNEAITSASGTLKTFTTERPGTTKLEKIDVDDTMWANLTLKSGAIASIETSRVATGKKNNFDIEIFGTKANINFNLERLNELNLYETKDNKNLQGNKKILITENTHPYMKSWWPPGHIIGWEHSFIHQIKEFLNHIETNTPPSPSLADGNKVQIVLDTIYASAQTNSSRIQIPQNKQYQSR